MVAAEDWTSLISMHDRSRRLSVINIYVRGKGGEWVPLVVCIYVTHAFQVDRKISPQNLTLITPVFTMMTIRLSLTYCGRAWCQRLLHFATRCQISSSEEMQYLLEGIWLCSFICSAMEAHCCVLTLDQSKGNRMTLNSWPERDLFASLVWVSGGLEEACAPPLSSPFGAEHKLAC